MEPVIQSGDELIIRPAELGEAESLAAFGERAFRAAFAADNDPADIEQYLAQAFAPEQIAAELADPASLFLVAYLQERLAGYVRLYAGEAPESVTGPRPVELVRIYVDPDVIGRGYGGKLMQACLDQARHMGHETIWLGVWEHNTRAQAFYRRWSFQQVGTHAFTLGQDVQTDWIMARSL